MGGDNNGVNKEIRFTLKQLTSIAGILGLITAMLFTFCELKFADKDWVHAETGANCKRIEKAEKKIIGIKGEIAQLRSVYEQMSQQITTNKEEIQDDIKELKLDILREIKGLKK
jgi:hypothetical protein